MSRPTEADRAASGIVKTLAAETCEDLLQQIVPDQPALPGIEVEQQQALAPGPVDYPHTGRRVLECDPNRALMVGALRLAGRSDREIARTCRVARESIPGIVAGLERQGKLRPLKDRLTEKAGWMAESAANTTLEILEDMRGADDPKLLSALAAAGKTATFAFQAANTAHSLATGQATEIVEHKGGAPSQSALSAWLEKHGVPAVLEAEEVPPSEFESDSLASASRSAAACCVSTVALSAACDTDNETCSAPKAAGSADPDDPEAAGSAGPVRAGGGGGARSAVPPDVPDDSDVRKICGNGLSSLPPDHNQKGTDAQ